MHANIQIFVEKLKKVLIEGGSINDVGDLWTLENFNSLHKATEDNLKKGNESFLHKILAQIQEAKTTKGLEDNQSLLPLIIEILGLYYVFPSHITRKTKISALEALISSDNDVAGALKVEQFSVTINALKLDNKEKYKTGIGSGGMGYNTNKKNEIFFLINVFVQWFSKSETNRVYLLDEANRVKFQNFIDDVEPDRTPQCRHVLLHLFYPDYYQPIISGAKKQSICDVFEKFIDPEKLVEESGSVSVKNDVDQRIKVICNKISEIRNKPTNFYDDDLYDLWDSSTEELLPDLNAELLKYKKQIVLYGPPGTSKTYTAKTLAREAIRYHLAKDLGVLALNEEGQVKIKKALANNIHRLQLHPAYSYEDFIRGLQIKGGDTIYASGYLLRLLDKMQQEPDLPHVLILDEINRVDLSRLFGECFSALENRGESIELLGSDDEQEMSLNIPENLYIIGTMNLIDHSVEQLDFALRRRFLWVEVTYNSEALLAICKERWQAIKWEKKTNITWERVEGDFNKLVNAADNLNRAISNEGELGRDFVLGHVFFLEVVEFLKQFLQLQRSGVSTYLFTGKGEWKDPVEKLWRLSLRPLLREYLSGLDSQAQNDIMKKLQGAFKP